MRKKITSALFIILANLVLMVHAVVPHHHHVNINLCFNLFASEIEPEHDNCEPNGDNHEHSTDSDRCFLQNIVALSSVDIKQNLRGISCSNDLLKKISVLAVLNKENRSLSSTNYFLENNFTNYNYDYLSLACRAFGLRAPPIAS